MTKSILPILFFTAALLLSCEKENIDNTTDNSQAGDSAAQVGKTAVVQGVMRIRLTPEAESRILLPGDSPGILRSGLDELDIVAKKIGVTKIERVFKHGGKYEKRRREAGLHLWYNVYFDRNTPLTRAGNDISAIEGVDLIEPVYPIQPAASAEVIRPGEIMNLVRASQETQIRNAGLPFNDPGLHKQWHYRNDGSSGSGFLAGADINLFPAWELTTGNNEVIVAIMDGGIDYNHEDLAGNMWVNKAEKNGSSGTDDDHNGYVDDIFGWNFVDDKATIQVSKHGTHVAGTIGAVNNNGIGVSGVAGGNGTGNGVKLMCCQLFSTDLFQDPPNVQDAYAYAADNGAVISQNSWSYGTDINTLPEVDKAAIDYFIKYAGKDENGVQTGPLDGGLIIFSAGNYHMERQILPQAYEKIMAVASMGPNFVRATYTSFGAWVDVIAPGGDSYVSLMTVYSTLPGNSYGYMEGTSMACPHVSGIAALLAAKHGSAVKGVSGNDIRKMIESTTNDIYPYNNASYAGKLGTGYVDAYRALTEQTDGGTLPVPPASVNLQCFNQRIDLAVTVTQNGEGYVPNRYEIFYSERDIGAENLNNPSADVSVGNLRTESANNGDIAIASITGLRRNTKYYFAVRAWNVSGGYAPAKFLEGTTVNYNPPENIADLNLRWSNGVTVVSWSVTNDPDDTKPDVYNVYYSAENLSVQDWDAIVGNSGIELERVSMENYTVGEMVSVKLRGLTDKTVYYFAVEGVDKKSNASDFAFGLIYTANNSAPMNTDKLPDLVFNYIGESKTIDMGSYFSNDDPVTMHYTLSSFPEGSLDYTVSGDKITIISRTEGTGSYSVTATDYAGLGVTASAGFSSKTGSVMKAVTMYPNPVSSVLNISLPVGVDGQVEINIYNTVGSLVRKHTSPLGPDRIVQVDMSKLSSAVYTISVECNSGETKRRITKL